MSEETQVKRARAKDESPMALAKVAATKLRRIDQGIAHARFTMGTIAARIDKQAAERAEYVLTLDDSVVAILKAGGVL